MKVCGEEGVSRSESENNMCGRKYNVGMNEWMVTCMNDVVDKAT
jgi:hypothetical protein